jgi:hypothetical protein
MINLGHNDYANQTIALLTIGSDLVVEDCNHAWRAAGLPGLGEAVNQRIDKLFPGSEVGAYVLDVLSSGNAVENCVIGLGGKDHGRYLWANFHPLPAGVTPKKVKKVLMQAWETNTRLLLDRVTGKVLEAKGDAQPLLGGSASELHKDSPWRVMPDLTEAEFEQALAIAERKGTHYLGRFQQRRPDGSNVEMETLLMFVDGPEC